MNEISRIALMSPVVVSMMAMAWAQTGPAERIDFDSNWKFARFGEMPEGPNVIKPEPGAPIDLTKASSQENHNPSANAIDGKLDTRWCAANGQGGQWLEVDLGREVELADAVVVWEKNGKHPFKLDISADGKEWKPVVDRKAEPVEGAKDEVKIGGKARYVKVWVDANGGNWASIRELELKDAKGDIVLPEAADGKKEAAPQDIAFDDSGWRSLNLPHDWGVEGPFRMDLENETGKLPWHGIGWYRKVVEIPASYAGKQVYLDFDGVMSQPSVYVNGKLAGEWKYGYNSFRIDITKFIQPGQKNTVAVRVNNLAKSSRWYPGGGIYRHVWLEVSNPVHVAQWGVYVTTPEVTKDSATVALETTVSNKTDKEAKVSVASEILDSKGKVVASYQPSSLTLKPGADDQVKTSLTVANPKLWDINSPNLYKVRTTIKQDGKVVDVKTTPFGIRTIQWDPKQGFLLNGRVVKLQGVCQHHDLGPLGSAVHRRGIERQIEILKDMGVNSIRTSHNPPAPELLELCDEMGILVIDELFDSWKLAKKPNGYNLFWDEWHEKDARNFMLRDRNHPSVIAWSTGNEIPELGATDHHWVAEKLYNEIRKYDRTRPVTAGSNHPGAATNGFQKFVDVYGVNYHLDSYKNTAEKNPDKPVYASETSSCVSSRGEYFFPVSWDKNKGFYNFQVSSYDLYAPGWANRPDLQFEALDKFPNYAGEYVWTGFDYLGEPTPYNLDQTNALNFPDEASRKKAMEEMQKLGNRAPSRSSYFGIIDLCGFPKDRFYIYQARWRPDFKMAHILPHWNWPERVGQVTPVHVYSSGDEAELFLNGKSLGKRKKEGKSAYRFVWDDVVYAPGKLEVKVTKNGKPWATATKETTGEAVAVSAKADRSTLNADGKDLSYITLRIVDAKGREVPRSNNQLKFNIEGPVELAGVGNGDATDFSSFQKPEIKAYNGMAQLIVRSKKGEKGKATITVTGEGVKGDKVVLSTK